MTYQGIIVYGTSEWFHNMGGYNMINNAFAGTEKGHRMPDSFCLGF